MKKNILALTLPLLLISCIEVRDANEEKAAPVEAEAVPVAEVRALAQPHRYAVVVKGSSGMTQVLRKPISFLNQAPTAQIPFSNFQAEDVIDQPGIYEYSVQQGSRYYQLQVEIPEDYVVEGNIKIEQLNLNLKNDSDEFKTLEASGRLFFKAGSSLTTNGENFLVKVAMVDSEGALIQTFPPNLKAQMGVHGRHGGKIRIEAQSLRGTLHFAMRGEAGGMGEPVRSQNADNNGRNGGNSGSLEVMIQDDSQGDLTFDLLPGAGGEGVDVMNICVVQPCVDTANKPKGKDGAAGIAQQPKLKK